MKNKLVSSILAALFVLGMAATANALSLSFSPGDEKLSGSDPNNPNAHDVYTLVTGEPCNYASNCSDYENLYKNDVDEGDDTESLAWAYYSTEYFNTPTDPKDATISWDGPGKIVCPECWLVVKDGNQDPQWYIFDLNGWNGMDDIELTEFWPGQGAISHVQIVGCGTVVPEPATMLLLGTGLVGLAGVSRRRSKK